MEHEKNAELSAQGKIAPESGHIIEAELIDEPKHEIVKQDKSILPMLKIDDPVEMNELLSKRHLVSLGNTKKELVSFTEDYFSAYIEKRNELYRKYHPIVYKDFDKQWDYMTTKYDKYKGIGGDSDAEDYLNNLYQQKIEDMIINSSELAIYKENMSKFYILIQAACIYVDDIELKNSLLKQNIFFFSNFLNPKAYAQRDSEGNIYDCKGDPKNKNSFIHPMHIVELIKTGIMVTSNATKKYNFRASIDAPVEKDLTSKEMHHRVCQTIGDELYGLIKTILNNSAIVTTIDVFAPEYNVEFFVHPRTKVPHRNTFRQINKIDYDVLQDCPNILAFLFCYFCKEQEALNRFLDDLALFLRSYKASYVTTILYGKKGPGVLFFYKYILEPIFLPTQSVMMSTDLVSRDFKKLTENTILRYIYGDISTFDSKEDLIEERVNHLINEDVNYKLNIFNTEDCNFFDFRVDPYGFNILKVDNSLENFECFKGKPMRLNIEDIRKESESFRQFLLQRIVDENKAISLDNDAKAKAFEIISPIERFLENIKLANISYIEQAKSSRDQKVMNALTSARKGFSVSSKIQRYISQSKLYPLFSFIENVKMSKSKFFSELKALDKDFFCEENTKKHNDVVYIIDSKYNNLSDMSK